MTNNSALQDIESKMKGLDQQLSQLNVQRNFLQEKKAELEKEKQKLLPNAFTVLKNGKRKTNDFQEDPEFQALRQSLHKRFKKTGDENKTGTLMNYTQEEKKITISLTKKYSNVQIAEVTKISITNIKKWKKLPEEDLIPAKRGKRVTNPMLEEELKE